MACFWNGINNSLVSKLKSKSYRPIELVEFLKKNNRKTYNMLWNNKRLSNKELEENYERVKSYDSRTVHQGYDCSCADPFLLLIGEIFKVNIVHNFNGTIVKYTCINNDNTTLSFGSNRGHFWDNKNSL